MAISPSSSLATLRPDLSGALMEFDLQANINDMVGLKIAPVIEVDRQAGNWGRIPIEELLKGRSDSRAPGTGYNRGNGKFEPDTYSCTEHGVEETVDDREASMYADYFDAEVVAAMRARNIVLSNLEADIVTAATSDATAWGGSAFTAWSNTSSSTPIANVTSMFGQLYGQIGKTRAALAVSWVRYNQLRNNAEIIDRVKYSGFKDVTRDNITAEAIAQALDVDELIVARAVKNTKNEGKSEADGAPTLAGLWTDSLALLFVKPKSIDPREPAFMRTFHWGVDGSQIGAAVESYRDESVRGNVVRVRMDRHVKTIYGAAAVKATI